MTQPASSNKLPPLSSGELRELSDSTKYSEKQVKDWHRYNYFIQHGTPPPPYSPLVRGFLGQCPHGELDKQKLFDMYCLLLPPGIAKIFVDQLFTIFDGDKSGSIDFKV